MVPLRTEYPSYVLILVDHLRFLLLFPIFPELYYNCNNSNFLAHERKTVSVRILHDLITFYNCTVTFFWFKSVQLIELKNGWAMMSRASSGPPPNLLLGSFTNKPLNKSLASADMFLGNFTYKLGKYRIHFNTINSLNCFTTLEICFHWMCTSKHIIPEKNIVACDLY